MICSSIFQEISPAQLKSDRELYYRVNQLLRLHHFLHTDQLQLLNDPVQDCGYIGQVVLCGGVWKLIYVVSFILFLIVTET